MKVLITGGTGFLGKALASHLTSLQYNVCAIGRNEKIGNELKKQEINFIKLDIADGKKVLELESNFDYIFHCAALTSPYGKYQDFYQANVLGTKNIIDLAQKCNLKRFIHVSSTSIYMSKEHRLNIQEEDSLPKKALTHYAATKILAEKEVDFAYGQGLPVITIRPQAIFGPGDQVILPRIIKVARKGVFPVIGDGKQLIDLTYVDNVVEALLCCMSSPLNTIGQKYNITNGQPQELAGFLLKILNKFGYKVRRKYVGFNKAYLIASAVEIIYKVMGLKTEPPLSKYSVLALGKSRTLSIKKAENELGYRVKISIDEGIGKLTHWWLHKNANC